MRTVTARMVGWTLVVSRGGSGPVVDAPAEAADALLRGERVRMPKGQGFAARVRRVLAMRALDGEGPEGDGRNWG